MTFLLSFEDRDVLGQRTPREIVQCVECGNDAERSRNGDWECIHLVKQGVYSYLTCGARGITLGEELVTVSCPQKP